MNRRAEATSRGPILRSRIFWKAFLSILVPALLTALVVLGIAVRQSIGQAQNALELRLEERARLLAALGSELTLSEVEGRVATLAAELDCRLSVIDDEGRIVADSAGELGRSVSARQEILVASRQGKGVARRPGNKGGESDLHVAVKFEGVDGDSTWSGFARASQPDTTSVVDVGQGPFLKALLPALMLCVAIAFWVARAWAARVLTLATGATIVAAGESDRGLASGGSDELAALARLLSDAGSRLVEQGQALDGLKRRLSTVLEKMTEGLLAVDRDEHILHMNSVAALWLEVDEPGSRVGRPLYEATRSPEILESVGAVLSDGVEVRRSLRSVVGGGERILDLVASPLSTGSDGEDVSPVGAVLVLHDTTQLHRLEGIRREFVSNVSHELKTPLTAIRGFVETLLDVEDVDAETRRRFLKKIRQQTHRLSTLVSDLLSLSRVEAGADAIEGRPVDLRAPLIECLRSLRPDIERRRLQVSVDYPDRPVVVEGEEEPVRMAFSNLIDNAIKYSDAGGRIVIQLTEAGEHALFEVRDDGAGIDRKHQERVFERFYRVDKARSRELGGTGLGLAIVKNVAQTLGGVVEVESELGEGSTFRIRLPKAAVATTHHSIKPADCERVLRATFT